MSCKGVCCGGDRLVHRPPYVPLRAIGSADGVDALATENVVIVPVPDSRLRVSVRLFAVLTSTPAGSPLFDVTNGGQIAISLWASLREKGDSIGRGWWSPIADLIGTRAAFDPLGATRMGWLVADGMTGAGAIFANLSTQVLVSPNVNGVQFISETTYQPGIPMAREEFAAAVSGCHPSLFSGR